MSEDLAERAELYGVALIDIRRIYNGYIVAVEFDGATGDVEAYALDLEEALEIVRLAWEAHDRVDKRVK